MFRLLFLLPVLLLGLSCSDSNLNVQLDPDCDEPLVCEHPKSEACFQRQIAWSMACTVPVDDEDEDDDE